MWYRLTFDKPNVQNDKILLHFGAVDWQTAVYLNGVNIGNHTGGYDGFSFDVTPHIGASNELLIYVYDPSDSGTHPNGKQRISAIDSPGGDTYTPNSGIWQTIWLEGVPDAYISGLKINQASMDTIKFTVDATAASDVAFEILDGGVSIGKGTGVAGSEISYQLDKPKLWSAKSPNLYDIVITLPSGDKVTSYFGLRTFELGAATQVPEGPYTE